MKIKIENIQIPWYAPREEFDQGFIEELTGSMEVSGQWDPILVRRNDEGKYDLIAGSQRLEAAKFLGWTEIDAKEIDVSEEEAAMLSVETNLKRKGLQEIEEGKAIKKIIDEYSLTHKQISERLGKSERWVGSRLSLALDVIKEVQNAIGRGFISIEQALIIGQLPKKGQGKFLNLIIETQRTLDRKLTRDEVRLELRRFLNDTIYTIGYEGWDLAEFIKTLKDNKTEILVDIRESGASMYKPEFSKKVLKERVIVAGIKYFDRSEFGVPYEIREAYINGKPYEINGTQIEAGFPHECFKQWYLWHVKDNAEKLIKELKDSGKSVLLCSEKYPQPKGDQKHYCHRDILANLMLEVGVFDKRVDF